MGTAQSGSTGQELRVVASLLAEASQRLAALADGLDAEANLAPPTSPGLVSPDRTSRAGWLSRPMTDEELELVAAVERSLPESVSGGPGGPTGDEVRAWLWLREDLQQQRRHAEHRAQATVMQAAVARDQLVAASRGESVAEGDLEASRAARDEAVATLSAPDLPPDVTEALEAELRRADVTLRRAQHQATEARHQVMTLRHTVEQLAREQDEAQHTMAEIDQRLGTLERLLEAVVAEASAPPVDDDVPLRELVLRALKELGGPVAAPDLADYLTVRFGREVDARRFGTLRRDEERAYRAAVHAGRQRPVWIVPALDNDGTADRRYLCRSDHDLGTRAVANMPQACALWHLLRLAERPPSDVADLVGLLELVEDWIGDDPPVDTKAPLGEIADQLFAELAPFEAPGELAKDAVMPTDRRPPPALSRFASRADDHQLLFGADHALQLENEDDR